MNISLMHGVHSVWPSSLKSWKLSSVRINLYYLDIIAKTFRQSQFLTNCKNANMFEELFIIWNCMKKVSQQVLYT